LAGFWKFGEDEGQERNLNLPLRGVSLIWLLPG